MTIKEILRSDDIQRIESEIINAHNGIGIRYRNKENFSAMQSEVAAQINNKSNK